ncbi:hypothetical protein V1506DRAFT_526447 [Lipomyces tetrasporus]
MADFLLYDTPNIHRPSTSFHFPQAGSGYSADFDNALFFQSSNPYNISTTTNVSPAIRRRESTSLPTSLSSTPTQPSFFATYYANNRADPSAGAQDSIDDAMTVPGLSPSPGVTRSGSDEFGSNSSGIGSGMFLRNPFANEDDITPPSGRMDCADDESKQYSLGRRMSEDPSSEYTHPSNFKNPKLERTISDVLEDELYSPNMSPVQSTASDDFLLDFADTFPHSWTAKSLPVTRTASPSSFREKSPFRKSSPYYPGPPPDSPLMHSQSHYNLFPLPTYDAGPVGNQQKFQRVQQASDNLRAMSSSPQPLPTQTKFVPVQQKSLQQQLQQLQLQKQQQQQSQQRLQQMQQQQQQQQIQSLPLSRQPQLIEQTSTKTISPKEALLDYVEGEESISDPEAAQVGTSRLFAPTPSSSSSSSMNAKLEDPSDVESGDDFADFELFARPTSYPRSQAQYEHLNEDLGTPTQSSVVSSPGGSDYEDSSTSNNASTASSIGSKHIGVSLDRGLNISSPAARTPEGSDEPAIFVCPDCGKRFPKAHNLQLHRRTHSLTPPRKKVPLSAQTGPHRCTWINPATGKICNKVFSRPYDLIRHQETIHASNRKTFKCELCGDDTKTFSRQDALARHIRVKHEKGK